MKIYLVTQIGSDGFDPQLNAAGYRRRLANFFDLGKQEHIWTREKMEEYVSTGEVKRKEKKK